MQLRYGEHVMAGLGVMEWAARAHGRAGCLGRLQENSESASWFNTSL